MNRTFTVLGIVVLLAGLILVRAFETSLFYDPLLEFFKSQSVIRSIPAIDMSKLLVSTSVRFWINSIISLAIIGLLFKSKEIIKVAGLLYLVIFLVLILLFTLVLQTSSGDNFLLLFYVRRFLIQPLLLLLLIPAFYFYIKT